MSAELSSMALWLTPLLVVVVGYFVRRSIDKIDGSIAGLHATDIAQGKQITALEGMVATLREKQRDYLIDFRLLQHQHNELRGFAQRRGFVVRPNPPMDFGPEWEPTPDPDPKGGGK